MADALPFQRWSAVLAGLFVVILVLVVVGTPGGRGAATELLSHFRNQRLAAAALDTTEIADIEATLSEIAALGTLSGVETAPEPRAVESVSEASKSVGFPVLAPDPATLPAGVGSDPATIRVAPAHQMRFTVDLERIRAHYQSTGLGDVDLPERFDGASLVVDVPAAVMIQYRGDDGEKDEPAGFGLVIGQAGTLAVGAEGGVTLDELQDFLLDLPGLSPETERQLEAIDDWETTLPVPLPIARVNWERATIAGHPGLLLDDNSGLASAAIWLDEGRVFGIVGTMNAEELRDVAESLR